jgi:hypothetical protein
MYNKETVVEPDVFSTSDVCKICNIDRERFLNWIDKEYILPNSSMNDAPSTYEFDTMRVLWIMVFKLLVEEGYDCNYASILLQDAYEDEIMELDIIQLEAQSDSIIWTTIEMDNPRKAVFRGIKLLKGELRL